MKKYFIICLCLFLFSALLYAEAGMITCPNLAENPLLPMLNSACTGKEINKPNDEQKELVKEVNFLETRLERLEKAKNEFSNPDGDATFFDIAYTPIEITGNSGSYDMKYAGYDASVSVGFPAKTMTFFIGMNVSKQNTNADGFDVGTVTGSNLFGRVRIYMP